VGWCIKLCIKFTFTTPWAAAAKNNGRKRTLSAVVINMVVWGVGCFQGLLFYEIYQGTYLCSPSGVDRETAVESFCIRARSAKTEGNVSTIKGDDRTRPNSDSKVYDSYEQLMT
jgi:hypothetical protein